MISRNFHCDAIIPVVKLFWCGALERMAGSKCKPEPKSVELTYKLSRQVLAGNTIGENVSKRNTLSIVVKPTW